MLVFPRAPPRRRRPRWRSASRLGKVEVFGQRRAAGDLPGHARPGQEPGRGLPARHVRLAHRRLHRRHPDHGHAAERPRGGRAPAARPSSPARTRPTRTSSIEEKERVETLRVVHTIEAVAAAGRTTTRRPRSWPVAVAPGQGAPAGVAAPLGSALAGAGGHRLPRRRHGPRRRAGPADRSARPARPRPSACTGTSGRSGDLVIWDNRGVLHRACRYDPTSPRDMHRTTLAGDEAIQ